jgi:dolichol-phosphate mannosyltransferase
VIVVNDNSTDKTKNVTEALKKKYKKIRLINRNPPGGVGLALRQGFKNIDKKSDWVLMMDSDFIYNVPDIAKMIEKAKQGYDGVIGSRYIEKKSFEGYPMIKKIANRIFHHTIGIIFRIKQKDLTNNFKLYKKEIIENINFKSSDFAINAETGILPVLLKYNITEVPVKWIQRSYGLSDFKVFKLAPHYCKVGLRAINIVMYNKKIRQKNS